MFLYCRRSRKACHWPCWKPCSRAARSWRATWGMRSEEHTSELQSQSNLVCRLLLEKKKSRFLGRPDLLYRLHRLAIEYDGGNHRDRLFDDNRRQNGLVLAGLPLLPFTAAYLNWTPH